MRSMPVMSAVGVDLRKDPIPNRWTIVAAAAAVMLTIGTIYSWAIFTQPLLVAYRWNLTTTTWAYAIANFSLAAVGAVIGGFWQDRVGPRIVAMAGVTFWACGNVLAGLGTSAFGRTVVLRELRNHRRHRRRYGLHYPAVDGHQVVPGQEGPHGRPRHGCLWSRRLRVQPMDSAASPPSTRPPRTRAASSLPELPLLRLVPGSIRRHSPLRKHSPRTTSAP